MAGHLVTGKQRAPHLRATGPALLEALWSNAVPALGARFHDRFEDLQAGLEALVELIGMNLFS